MNRFLVLYVLVYGSVHLYFFLKARKAFKLSARRAIALGIFLVFVFVAPLLGRFLERTHDISAGMLSLAGYCWMGALFLFITAAVVIDVFNLICRLYSKLNSIPSAPIVSAQASFLIPALYTALTVSYGWYEALHIRTGHIVIQNPKMSPYSPKIRIVQISDVHVGQIVSERRIKIILDAVRSAAPDMLVSTGDLVDGHQKHLDGLEKLFKEFHPRLGKIAIPGNHEYYVGIDRSIQFMRDAGFLVLRDQTFQSEGNLTLIGIDDPRGHGTESGDGHMESQLLDAAQVESFILLLKHRPVVIQSSIGKFDLQLSGHVHKGQIFPFNFLTWMSFPVKAGLTHLSDRSSLYVSRGTGTWGPPIRFLAPPEITVIDIMPTTAPTGA